MLFGHGTNKKKRSRITPTPPKGAASNTYLSILSLNIVVHIHEILDGLYVIRDVCIAMDGVLDNAACNCEVYDIHRAIVVHHCVDQTTGKCVTASDTIQNGEGIGTAFEGMSLNTYARLYLCSHASRSATGRYPLG